MNTMVISIMIVFIIMILIITIVISTSSTESFTPFKFASTHDAPTPPIDHPKFEPDWLVADDTL